MKFTIEQRKLIKPLQQVCGVAGSSRTKLSILSNLLLKVEDSKMSITCTDLEAELTASLTLSGEVEPGSVTIPARKLFSICRSLPGDSGILFSLEMGRLRIYSDRSYFSLSVLPPGEFPSIENWQKDVSFSLPQGRLRALIEATQFSMANQDVRHFLNGMFFEIDDSVLKAVATDGHRMAVGQTRIISSTAKKKIIVPRKSIQELARLLCQPEEKVRLEIGSSNIRVRVGHFVFTSRLIDGRFPDYRQLLPENTSKTLISGCDVMRQALTRVSILSREKFGGVRLTIGGQEMCIAAKNPEQEIAEETLDIEYEGEKIEIGFNARYILDILHVLRCETVKIAMSNPHEKALIKGIDGDNTIYVIMPVRL